MSLFKILKKETSIFLINDIEDKKTKSLIQLINEQLVNILTKFEEFESFASSQLSGEYNKKILMAKSLCEHYNDWPTINNACNLLKNEEAKEISNFLNEKRNLIENLKTLLKDSQKLPVVSAFDVYDDDYFKLKAGHPVIILGGNNTIIIDKLIYDLEQNCIAVGNYDKISPIELNANYSSLESNVSECNNKIDELFYNKKGKYEKLTSLVENMQTIGEKLVFFATYKQELLNVGCSQKEVDLFEKDLLKKYITLKKHLQKALKFEFLDICDIKVNENEYFNFENNNLLNEDDEDNDVFNEDKTSEEN